MTHKKPSVSKLLDLLNKPALMYWANNLGLEGMSLKKYRKRRLSLGTSLHKQVEYFLVDGLIPDNELLKNNFIDFFTDIEVLGVEQKVENEFFQGRYDVKLIKDGKTYICDFKSKFKKPYLEQYLQLTAYRMIENVDNIAVISLPDFRFVDISLPDYTIHENILINLSNIYNLKKRAMEIIKTKKETNKEYYSPVYNVRRIHSDKIRANSYNPNAVAPPEMKLLEISIWEDGYTMPVVCYYDKKDDVYEIVDGYHRYTTLKTSKRIYEREQGYLPIVVIDKDESNRMASTIRHNRARGAHSVELMSNIVSELVEAGMSDQWIKKHIGMDRDELLRLKQITGLASMFKDLDFSICSGLNDLESRTE